MQLEIGLRRYSMVKNKGRLRQAPEDRTTAPPRTLRYVRRENGLEIKISLDKVAG